ncbi:hypothetical protein SH661x_001622 [Planctomicrobium sp. SH661]|uniref:hypothetical protein n=1 Tax=Planctomicrobium sp. SH661 TaxID=3448124 RepID=UPI003F5B9EBD
MREASKASLNVSTGSNGDEVGQGGVSSITPPPNTQQCINQVGGVDSISINVWADMPEGPFGIWMGLLAESQLVARAKHSPAIITVGLSRSNQGYLASVHERGSRSGAGFKYVVEIDGVRFLFSGKPSSVKRANVMVEAMGGAMLRFGWSARELWQFAEQVLRAIGYRVDNHSIGRIDCFVDVPGIKAVSFRKAAQAGRCVRRANHVAPFSVASEEQLHRAIDRSYERGKAAVIEAVSNVYDNGLIAVKAAVSKARLDGEMDLATYGCGGPGSGLQVGRRDVICRVYDKVFQLERFHPERLEVMREAWGVANDVPVTRIEYQLRGAWLRSYKVRSVDDFEARSRAVVEYLTETWFLLADYDGHNKDRRHILPVWKRVQAVFRSVFGRRRKRMRKAEPAVDPKTTNRLIKTAVSLLRTASGRAFGPIEQVGEYRLAVHQLVEHGVEMFDGWENEYSGHLHRLNEYFQRGGFETEPSYPFQVWSRRPELVDVAGMTGLHAMAGVPNG